MKSSEARREKLNNRYRDVISKLIFSKEYSLLSDVERVTVQQDIQERKNYINNGKLVKLDSGKVILASSYPKLFYTK